MSAMIQTCFIYIRLIHLQALNNVHWSIVSLLVKIITYLLTIYTDIANVHRNEAILYFL